MHIPENYLSTQTCALCMAVMLPVWHYAMKKTKAELTPAKLPLLGLGAAFAFLGMMFNIPFPGGTTGHAVGGTLIAVLLGPHAACLALTIALVLQAVLFGDGGVLSIGANCFNMAFVLPYSGYAVYRQLQKWGWSPNVSAAAGSYVGINMAALLAAVEFGLQPLLFTTPQGQPLYCPYGLSIAIPAMALAHLTLFGLAEIIFTVGILSYLRKTMPVLFMDEEAQSQRKFSLVPLFCFLGALIVLTPLGTLAEGVAWGEWSPEAIEHDGQVLGYVPQGMQTDWSWPALMPDYALEGVPEVAAYVLSALLGVIIIMLIVKLWSFSLKHKTDFSI